MKTELVKLSQIRVNGANPVSYTHLDVYKRQVMRLQGYEKKQSGIWIKKQ